MTHEDLPAPPLAFVFPGQGSHYAGMGRGLYESLIGAAILLVSIKLSEEILLGLSVPFEIKALIILAIGKLFQPVLDQLGVDFQNVVNHVKDIRDKYFSNSD